jgi:long-chain fatty acid transport protein
MKKHVIYLAVVLIAVLAMAPLALATNGSNLIGVGPMSRSMGGVGVAAPQDAISAIFANPAAICFGPFCPGAQADFSGTYFNPTVKGKMKATVPTGDPGNPFMQVNGSDTSETKPSAIPAIGISSPLSPKWRFGIGAYGVSGMGVSYKESDLPLPGNLYTKLEVMNFAPNVAYMISPDFSVGANLLVSYQNLDLGNGADHGYGMGVQLGGLYTLGIINFGAAYTYNQSVTHKKVAYFDDYDMTGQLVPDATLDDLELQSPQVAAFGLSVEPGDAWLVELDTKWINWSGAKGYKDFDWEDQWVLGLGAQFKITPAFSLRAGYNYAKSPVKEHDGFDPMGTTNVQGHDVGNVNYEALRILGFPAVVEHHVTLGLGYKFANAMAINLSYLHALENTIEESSAGDAFSFESSLKEDTITLGFSWFF